ncbi:MAG: LysE family transporter [Proteobacteria bacterium]|nr:LysE family transporter [Pseudomonadota bacterium]
MILLLLLKGIAVGIAIAAPVGPVAVLCIRRTLLQGPPAGFASGFGAVAADVIFGAMATFGVAALADTLLEHEIALRVIGGAFLTGLGINTYLKDPPQPGQPLAGRLIQSLASAFLLTITNPITIFAFTAIFAGFGIVGHDMSLPASWSLIVGVAIGATLWWSGLTLAAGFLRERVAVHELRWLNKLSGGLILVFAAGSFASLGFFR